MAQVEPSLRHRFLRAVRELEGIHYLWGGKSVAKGLDCSGVVTLGLYLAGGPDLRPTYNSDAMWAEWPSVEEHLAQAGDVAVYGHSSEDPDDVSHVMVLFEHGRVFGACGGDRRTTTRNIALQMGARVDWRDSHRYRRDFRGFVRPPWF